MSTRYNILKNLKVRSSVAAARAESRRRRELERLIPKESARPSIDHRGPGGRRLTTLEIRRLDQCGWSGTIGGAITGAIAKAINGGGAA